MSDTPTQNDWLDTAYVTKILNSYTQNQLGELKSFSKGPATAKLENFASSMELLTAEFTTQVEPEAVKDVSLIVKSRQENELVSQIEEGFNMFLREAQVYKEILDAASKLLASIGDTTILGPKAIYVDDRVIVQENLKLKGYGIEDVKLGLDFEQCCMILEKLAKFHALSMVLYKKNPDMFRHHLPGNVTDNSSPFHDFYANAIQTTVDFCKTTPSLERYVHKLELFGAKIIPKMINVFSRNQADRFHVLNHGDVWVNNVMFRKDSSGQPEDMIFVDFQEGFFGSPGIDWNYFMFTSWQTDLFSSRFDELVKVYHSALSDILHKLNYEQRIPTVEDVKKEIMNKAFHGLTTATCLLPVLINEHTELSDPENFLTNTDEAKENRRISFNNPKFAERLEVFLEYFDKNGVL